MTSSTKQSRIFRIQGLTGLRNGRKATLMTIENKLTYKIIGCTMKVHNKMQSGFSRLED
jgi:hypothetical protein